MRTKGFGAPARARARAEGEGFGFHGRVLVWEATRIVLGGRAQGGIPARVVVQSLPDRGEPPPDGSRQAATVVRGMATHDGLYLELRPDPPERSQSPGDLQIWADRTSANRLRHALQGTDVAAWVRRTSSKRDLMRDLWDPPAEGG
jgi:hypothetical protein